MRFILSIFASIARFVTVAPLAIGQSFWQTLVAAMAALQPKPYTPADAVADEAEAVLTEDDAAAPVEQRRAAREAKRAQAALSAEIAQAASEEVALKKVRMLTNAEVAEALAGNKPEKKVPFKHVKPEEMRMITYWPPPKKGEVESPIREATRWLYNSLCPLPAYEVKPTLDRLSPELKAWFKHLDRDQRRCVCSTPSTLLEAHLLGDALSKWLMQPGVPHRDKAHRDAHRAWIAQGNRSGIWKDPVTGVAERLYWAPSAALADAADEYGAYVPVHHR